MSQIDPIAATFLQGLEHHKQGRLNEAEAHYRAVLAQQPAHFDAVHFSGLLLWHRGRPAEAVDWIGRAIALNPNVPDAHSNLGLALQALKRNEEALASYDRALALRATYPEAHNNRGNALLELRRLPEALESFDRALQLNPAFAHAHNNRGNVLRALGRPAEAVACYDRALSLWPDFPDALNNSALILHDLKRNDEALQRCERLAAVAPHHPYALGMLMTGRLLCCDWRDYAQLSAAIAAGVQQGRKVDLPLSNLYHTTSAAIQLQCARLFAADLAVQVPRAAPAVVRAPHRRARLAYLSGDFKQHTVSLLAAPLFEAHDRTQFEVMGISYGADDGSDLRARLVRAFDQFVDVQAASDREAAQEISRREADIVVDLTGYTAGYRPLIVCHRPAPIQVNWLGYGATMGSTFHDYIMLDRFIVPPGFERFYSEKVVRLPETFMANERSRRAPDATPSRAEAGLPARGFVFCSFNNPAKINPPLFDVWMRLLKAIPESVLWLLGAGTSVVANMRRESESRGVAPDRLIFAPRVPVDVHLARHRLADLALDTFPYGAHTTGADALLAGLPMVAVVGESFAGRLSGSVVLAGGLPSEMVTTSLADYEAVVLALARSPERLARMREALVQNRPRAPLFDSDRLCRHVETAYLTMIERHRRGEPPSSFDVPPIA